MGAGERLLLKGENMKDMMDSYLEVKSRCAVTATLLGEGSKDSTKLLV